MEIDGDFYLEQLVRQAVQKGFPELAETPITTAYRTLDSIGVESGRRDNGYGIVVDTEFRRAPKHVIMGGIVTRLAHITYDRKTGWASRGLNRLLRIIPSYRANDEAEKEREACRRGFTRELIEFKHYLQWHGQDDDGLTTGEIRKIAN